MESTLGTLIRKITLDSVNDSIAASAAEALGHAGLRGPLPIPAGDLPSSSPPAVASGSSNTGVGESPMDTGKEQSMLPRTSTVVVDREPSKKWREGLFSSKKLP